MFTYFLYLNLTKQSQIQIEKVSEHDERKLLQVRKRVMKKKKTDIHTTMTELLFVWPSKDSLPTDPVKCP